MEGLVYAQKKLSTKIKEVYANLMKNKPEDKTVGIAQSEVQRLKEYFNTFNVHHEKIINLKNVDYNHDYFTSKLAEITENYYYRNKGRFNDFLKQYETTTVTYPACRKLPPIQIPEFSGKHTEWETFRDLFTTVIIENKAVAVVDKLYYLKTNVRGKALEIVNKYKLTVLNYDLAWQELINYYGNKRRSVETLLNDLFNVKVMKTENSFALNKLARDMNTPVESLNNLDRTPEQLWEDVVVYVTTHHFGAKTLEDWQKYLADNQEPPSKTKLDKFISSQTVYLEALEAKKIGSRIQTTPKKNMSSLHQTESINTPGSCSYCDNDHFIGNCRKFKSLNQTFENPERGKFIKINKLCYKCLGKHGSTPCKTKRCCIHCKFPHHSLLHFAKNKMSVIAERPKSCSDIDEEYKDISLTNAPKIESNSRGDKYNGQRNTSCSFDDLKGEKLSQNFSGIAKIGSPSSSHSCNNYRSGGVLLATAIIKVQGENGIELLVRALIDPCSQVSIMSGSLCQRLRLKVHKVNIPLNGTGGIMLSTVTKSAKVKIKPRISSDFSYVVDTLVLPKVSCYCPPPMKTSLILKHLDGLALADPQYRNRGRIDILLGAAVYSHIIEGAVVKGKVNKPIATSSALGWLLSGDTPASDNPNLVSGHVSMTTLHISQDHKLDDLLQKFWLQEEVPITPLYTKDEKKCEEHFSHTHTRNTEGRYIVKLPFKNPDDLNRIDLRQSFYPFQKMLMKMENRFHSDTKLKDMYRSFLREYEELDHMTLTPQTQMKSDKNCFYIPHHGIWKEKSLSTKLRTVFNGSLKLSSGVSLNDLSYSGPNLLPLLADIIINWRSYEFVFIADIEKMFRQILVHPDHRQYQCILWRTIKQLAKDYVFEHPWGAEVLRSEIYMDDILSGGHTVVEALKKQQSTTYLLNLGGFPFRTYLANNPDILRTVPIEYRIADSKELRNSESDISVLGLSWNPSEDTFYFNIIEFQPTSKLTKRIVLSRTAKLFDPLGWLAPILIKAKILMQLLWLEKKGWDDEIDVNHQKIWIKWENELSQIKLLKLPRYNNYSPQAEVVELHGFADASKLAYGASIYLRVVHDNRVFVTLITEKSKVAPLKQLSIPRLELSAARLLAKLAKHYVKQSKFCFTASHLWSDSMDVLYWLRGSVTRWRPSVAHRCSNIHEDMPHAL